MNTNEAASIVLEVWLHDELSVGVCQSNHTHLSKCYCVSRCQPLDDCSEIFELLDDLLGEIW